MGGKYEVRYRTDSEFQFYRDEYTNSIWELLRLLIKHRKQLIYFMVRFL